MAGRHRALTTDIRERSNGRYNNVAFAGGVDVATASVSYVDVAGELKLVEWPVVSAI